MTKTKCTRIPETVWLVVDRDGYGDSFDGAGAEQHARDMAVEHDRDYSEYNPHRVVKYVRER